MKTLFSEYSTNKAKEDDGTWVPIPLNPEGVNPEFRLRRLSKRNKAFSKRLDAKMKPHRKKLEHGVLSNEVAEGIMIDVFVDTILIDWRNVFGMTGVMGEDGVVIPFTRENAIELLTKVPELYDILDDLARDASTFKDYIEEQEAKNL